MVIHYLFLLRFDFAKRSRSKLKNCVESFNIINHNSKPSCYKGDSEISWKLGATYFRLKSLFKMREKSERACSMKAEPKVDRMEETTYLEDLR